MLSQVARAALYRVIDGLPVGEWTPIADQIFVSGEGPIGWHPRSGAKVTIEDAISATEAGMITMAQRKIAAGRYVLQVYRPRDPRTFMSSST